MQLPMGKPANDHGVIKKSISPVYRAFLEHQVGLKKFLRRYYRRAEDIDDAAQETFLRAFAAEARKEIDAPKEYLFQIAKHFALSDVTKKANTTTDYLEDFGASPVLKDEGHVAADEQLASRQKLAALVRAVAQLPPQCRRVFMLRKFDGLKVKDIAKRMNLSVSSVEKHIATGAVKCADYMAAHGHETGNKKRAPQAQRVREKPDTIKGQRGLYDDEG